MALRIGIDGTALSNRRGDGRFARNALGSLVRLHPEFEWTLYVDGPGADGFELPPRLEVRRVRQSRPAMTAFAAGSGRHPADLARMTLAVRRRELDAFLSPSVVNYFPVLGVPAVVGLHDATTATHPRLVLPERRNRALWRAKRALAVRRAARLFTVSEASRTAISEHLGVPAERVAVVPEAPDPAFEPQPHATVDAALAPLGLSREEGYFVYAAGLSPHKGLDALVKAYALLRGPGRAVPPLVVAGSPAGPYASVAEEVSALIAERGLEEDVRLPGFVSDHALACLYGGATGAIVPSTSEGFGLAAVEAAACGAAVVLSDIGPHRETLGDAGLFFAPGDVRALRQRLERLLDAPGERRASGERARAAVARLSWDETGRRLGELLVAAARRR